MAGHALLPALIFASGRLVRRVVVGRPSSSALWRPVRRVVDDEAKISAEEARGQPT